MCAELRATAYTRDKPCLTASGSGPAQANRQAEAERGVNRSCEEPGKFYSRYNQQKGSTNLAFDVIYTRSQMCNPAQAKAALSCIPVSGPPPTSKIRNRIFLHY